MPLLLAAAVASDSASRRLRRLLLLLRMLANRAVRCSAGSASSVGCGGILSTSRWHRRRDQSRADLPGDERIPGPICYWFASDLLVIRQRTDWEIKSTTDDANQPKPAVLARTRLAPVFAPPQGPLYRRNPRVWLSFCMPEFLGGMPRKQTAKCIPVFRRLLSSLCFD